MQLLTWRMAERCDPVDDDDTMGLIGDEAMDMALIFGRRGRQKIQPVRQQPFAGDAQRKEKKMFKGATIGDECLEEVFKEERE
ncbi:unnamed protein product [Cuscuta campestris]|uniref:Uncharacterized protein n=1 Tax=Cuscuta campestris TaxID=132261 RepID=A0A484KTP8_9ASTE|nr:unnamed protein product [Cuscuta campestris]